jgi:hypothetical protein
MQDGGGGQDKVRLPRAYLGPFASVSCPAMSTILVLDNGASSIKAGLTSEGHGKAR